MFSKTLTVLEIISAVLRIIQYLLYLETSVAEKFKNQYIDDHYL